MMIKTNTRIINSYDYEVMYEDLYKADHDITEAEVNDLLASDYHHSPITKAAASIDGNTALICYIVDGCD